MKKTAREKIIDLASKAAKEGKPFGVEKGMPALIALNSMLDPNKKPRKKGDPFEFIGPVTMDSAWGPWKRKGGSGNDGGFVLHWAAKGIGFGELTFVLKDGKASCDTECMSERFVKAAVMSFLEGLIYNHR